MCSITMTYPPYLRDKARRLRLDRKLTIDEIAERLAVSRTTVFHWTGDLKIPTTHRQSAAQQAATQAMVTRCRLIREDAYAEGREEFAELAAEPTFRDFVCLYIAEGYKRCRNTVQISNSDPTIAKLGHFWIARFARNPLIYYLQYHADQSIGSLGRFWSAELGIEVDTIRFVKKANSGQLRARAWRCKYGVISIRASDTLLRARLQGWIDCLEERWVDSLGAGV
jgi:transcriptional regulator with XRE-family HTH domain